MQIVTGVRQNDVGCNVVIELLRAPDALGTTHVAQTGNAGLGEPEQRPAAWAPPPDQALEQPRLMIASAPADRLTMGIVSGTGP